MEEYQEGCHSHYCQRSLPMHANLNSPKPEAEQRKHAGARQVNTSGDYFDENILGIAAPQ
eukprot:936276-Amphidinium_carterae.2